MASYSHLFSIEVEHSFFPHNLCRVLRFEPTGETRAVIRGAGLLVRETHNGVRVFFDAEKLDALQMYAANPDEPLSFRFLVFSNDSLFWNYTEPSIHKKNSIIYFDNRDAEVEENGNFRLHNEEFAGEERFTKSDDPVLKGFPNQQEALPSPVFAIAIAISESDFDLSGGSSPVSSKSYYVRFKARQTFWKYYLLGNLANQDFYINDQDDQIEFVSEGEASLADSRTALSFRTKTLLPLRERSTFRFQLRDRNSGGGKILIRRLPVASSGSISREIIDGEEAPVSEIFINR